jgi:hypothetical protein
MLDPGSSPSASAPRLEHLPNDRMAQNPRGGSVLQLSCALAILSHCRHRSLLA